MIIDQWRNDARILADSLPRDEEPRCRIEYLFEEVAPRGQDVDFDYFEQAIPLNYDGYLVVNLNDLRKCRTRIGEVARNIGGLAFVAHGDEVPSVLALPDYNPTTPKTNAVVITHKLQHVTELNEGLDHSTLGERERRAYGLNIATLSSLDGSDFKNFLDQWPVSYNHKADGFSFSARIDFHDNECPEPPRETYMHDMWLEGAKGAQILQSVCRMAVLERETIREPENVRNSLATNLQV